MFALLSGNATSLDLRDQTLLIKTGFSRDKNSLHLAVISHSLAEEE